MNPAYIEEVDEATVLDVDQTRVAQIVVYNDDVNTFDWVIECFVEILRHSSAQAEQLSLLIHYKGKAIVKTGSFEDLRPQKDALVDRGLSAIIEELVN